jgi:hypothetical protein
MIPKSGIETHMVLIPFRHPEQIWINEPYCWFQPNEALHPTPPHPRGLNIQGSIASLTPHRIGGGVG